MHQIQLANQPPSLTALVASAPARSLAFSDKKEAHDFFKRNRNSRKDDYNRIQGSPRALAWDIRDDYQVGVLTYAEYVALISDIAEGMLDAEYPWHPKVREAWDRESEIHEKHGNDGQMWQDLPEGPDRDYCQDWDQRLSDVITDEIRQDLIVNVLGCPDVWELRATNLDLFKELSAAGSALFWSEHVSAPLSIRFANRWCDASAPFEATQVEVPHQEAA